MELSAAGGGDLHRMLRRAVHGDEHELLQSGHRAHDKPCIRQRIARDLEAHLLEDGATSVEDLLAAVHRRAPPEAPGERTVLAVLEAEVVRALRIRIGDVDAIDDAGARGRERHGARRVA